MSIQFWFIGMIILSLVINDNAFPLTGSLTEEECKAYFTSNDVNKQIHAYFNCPKKLRPKHKRMEREIPKHFLMFNDDQQDHLPIFDGIKIK